MQEKLQFDRLATFRDAVVGVVNTFNGIGKDRRPAWMQA
jgi:hypothetical protein